METEALRIFVETARRGSFAAVARDRNVDPSSISRAVLLLEEELGVRLFHRTTRRMSLTEAGDRYLTRAEGLVSDLDAARDDARSMSAGPCGVLRVTASVAFGACYLSPLLPELRAAYPNLGLELVLSDAKLDLVADRIDLAVRLGQNATSDVVTTKLMDLRYRVCASPDYLARGPALERPEDLSGARCLLHLNRALPARWHFRDASGAVTEAPVSGDVHATNPLTLRECALRGMGPALLADWIVENELRSGALVDLFPDYQVGMSGFDAAAWLIYPSRSHLPNKVRVMIDYLKAHAARRAAERARPARPADRG